MMEELLKFRATAYLKMVRADIWAAPPRMLSEIQNWLVSAYASHVTQLAKYEIVLHTDAIREAAALADQMNSLILNMHTVLDAMKMDETKEIPIDFLYHDKFGWFEQTNISITKLDKDSFKLSIQGDGKSIYNNPLASKKEAIDAISDIVKKLLTNINVGIDKSPIIDLKLLWNTCSKMAGGMAFGGDSVGKTFPLNLEEWPYVDKIAQNNKKFLTPFYENNVNEIERLSKAESSLTELSDYAGPFSFYTAKGSVFKVDVMVDTKGSLNVNINGTNVKQNITVKNVAELVSKLNKSFVNNIDDYLEMPNNAKSLVTYLENEFPNKARINVVYEALAPEGYTGLWEPSTFTLYVRPLFINPIEAGLKTGRAPLDYFNKAVREIEVTVRHEMQHFSQTVASLLTTGTFTKQYGMPSSKTSPFERGKYDVSGVANEQSPAQPLRPYETLEDPSYGKRPDAEKAVMLKHPLRDVEYQTRLADEIDSFKDLSRMIPLGLRNRAIKVWTGELNEPLFPFANKTIWEEYTSTHKVGGKYILEFLHNNKIYMPNLENAIRNKMSGNKSLPVDADKYRQEMAILNKLNEQIKPSTFFSSLKKVIETDKDVGSSRWAKAVGSFIKEVS
jgi:hypothetical protein